MAADNRPAGGAAGDAKRDVPLNVPAPKEAEQYSLEMTPEDLDRQHDPREAQQVNRVILSGQGTAKNDRSTGGKAAPGGTPTR
jgi:hypothetical protein